MDNDNAFFGTDQFSAIDAAEWIALPTDWHTNNALTLGKLHCWPSSLLSCGNRGRPAGRLVAAFCSKASISATEKRTTWRLK